MLNNCFLVQWSFFVQVKIHTHQPATSLGTHVLSNVIEQHCFYCFTCSTYNYSVCECVGERERVIQIKKGVLFQFQLIIDILGYMWMFSLHFRLNLSLDF